MKQPKRSTFEIKIFYFPGSVIYMMDEIDEKQLQEIGTGSIVLHEGNSENAVMTEIYNLIKSFNKEGTSIRKSMIKFFKRDGRERKLRHHHHSGSFSYDYFELKDPTTKDSKILYVVLNKTFLTKTASTQPDRSIPSFSGYESDNYADFEIKNYRKIEAQETCLLLERVHKLIRYVILANWSMTSKCYIEFGHFVLKTLFRC